MSARKKTMNETEALYHRHEDLVEKAARSVWGRYGSVNGLDEDDYRQLGAMGLLEAIRHYQSDRGAFENYAYKKVKGAVLEGIRKCDEVKRSRRLRGARGPTVRLDAAPDHQGEKALLLRDTLVAREEVPTAERWEEVAKILSGLDSEARMTVYLHSVDGLSPYQIACVLGVPVEKVKLLREGAMDYLAKCRSTASDEKISQLELFAQLHP